MYCPCAIKLDQVKPSILTLLWDEHNNTSWMSLLLSFKKQDQLFFPLLFLAFFLFSEMSLKRVLFLKATISRFLSILSFPSLSCRLRPKLFPISALVWSYWVFRLERFQLSFLLSSLRLENLCLDIKIDNTQDTLLSSYLISSSCCRFFHISCSWFITDFSQLSVLFRRIFSSISASCALFLRSLEKV